MSYVKSLKRERTRISRASSRIVQRVVNSDDEDIDFPDKEMKILNSQKNRIDRHLHKFSTDMEFLMDLDNWEDLL